MIYEKKVEIYVQQYAFPLLQPVEPIAVDVTLQQEPVCIDYRAGFSEFFDVWISYWLYGRSRMSWIDQTVRARAAEYNWSNSVKFVVKDFAESAEAFVETAPCE